VDEDEDDDGAEDLKPPARGDEEQVRLQLRVQVDAREGRTDV
jgi:hypothetical protein